MNGFEKLRKEIEGQQDVALLAVVDYLLSRDDMEQKYLNEEKSIKGMVDFIKIKARKNMKNGWNFITNEVVFSWAIMYYTFPNSFLKIEKEKPKTTQPKTTTKAPSQNNVIDLDKAKEKLEKKKEIEQISLFGGV